MAKFPAHYKLKKDHPNSFEVHDARDGKSFHIAKGQLDEAGHKAIQKLPKFAEGGEIESPDTNGPEMPDWGMLGHAPPAEPVVSEEAAPEAVPAALKPEELALPQTPAAQPTKEQPDLLKQYAANTAETEAGLKALGEEKGKESTEQAEALQKTNAIMQDAADRYQKKLVDLNSENDNLTQAVVNSKIDPNRYIHNKSTANKIATAIALAIGGIGSGFAGRPNEAMAALHRSINEDIEAQKADLGKKQSLLSMNLQKYGNLEHATQATMAQMNAIAQGQIALTAAKHGGAINQANTQYMLGNLKNQNMLNQQQLANSLVTQQVARSAISGEGIPGQALGLLPEKERANMVLLPNGNWASAGSAENAKAVNEASAPYKPLMQDLNELKKLNTIGGALSPTQRNRATALQMHIVTELNDMAKAHRISEADIGFQAGQLSDPKGILNKFTSNPNAMTDQLMTSLSNKMDNVFKTYVPAYKGASSIQFTPKGK